MSITRPTLLQRVRNLGDQKSWSEFVALYEPLLLAYVRSRGLPECDAAEVVSEIFIALLRAMPSFDYDRQRGRFRTWLWQVTMTAISNHVRRQRSRNRVMQEWWQRHGKEEVVDSDQPDPDWTRAYQRRVLEHVLPQVQAQTQEKTWRCFEEHILRRRPGAEVAAEVGLTPNAVCVNAARVLKNVRALCAEEYTEDLDHAGSPLS